MTHLIPQQSPPQQTRSPQSRRLLIIAACVAALFTIANIILVVTLANKTDSDSADDNSPTDRVRPSAPVTVRFNNPAGWTDTDTYELLTPLYDNGHTVFITNESNNRQSIFVSSYVMDEDTTDWTDDQRLAKADEWAEQVGNTEETFKPVTATVNEKHAIHNVIAVKGSQGSIVYDTYYVFDGYYMIQIGAQPDVSENTEAVISAAETVLSSIHW